MRRTVAQWRMDKAHNKDTAHFFVTAFHTTKTQRILSLFCHRTRTGPPDEAPATARGLRRWMALRCAWRRRLSKDYTLHSTMADRLLGCKSPKQNLPIGSGLCRHENEVLRDNCLIKFDQRLGDQLCPGIKKQLCLPGQH